MFLNVLKVEISENLRFLRTDVVSVVALSGVCDDCPIKTLPSDGGILQMRSARTAEVRKAIGLVKKPQSPG